METIANFIFTTNVDELVWCAMSRDSDSYDWEKDLFDKLYKANNNVFEHKVVTKISDKIIKFNLITSEDGFNNNGDLQGFINMDEDMISKLSPLDDITKEKLLDVIKEEITKFMIEFNDTLCTVEIAKIPSEYNILYYEHQFYVRLGCINTSTSLLKLTDYKYDDYLDL